MQARQQWQQPHSSGLPSAHPRHAGDSLDALPTLVIKPAALPKWSAILFCFQVFQVIVDASSSEHVVLGHEQAQAEKTKPL